MKNHFFFSQPHQPFFVLAFMNAFLSMFLFMLMFKGIIATELLGIKYHAYSFIFLMFTPAFLAFLFTTFPRFSATLPIAKEHYLKVFWLFLVGSILFQLGTLTSIFLVGMGMMLVLLASILSGKLLLNIYTTSTINDKNDQKWILIAIFFGLLSHLLFILSLWLPNLHTFSVQMAIYLYLFLVTFVVAQRMIPFFSNSPIKKEKEKFKVIVGLLAVHVTLESIQPHSSFLVDFFLVYIIGKELYRWKLPFPNPNPLLWILHLALFWIPVAFLLSGISNFFTLYNGTNFLYMDIHGLLLGFLFTVLIGFGTRVTIGHSGNIMKADKWVILLFYWTQVVVVMRILTSLAFANGWNFLLFFDISVVVWLVMFGLWASRFLSVLIFGKKLN